MVECEVNNSFQGEEEDSTEASTTPSRTKVDSIETTVAEGDNDAQSKNVDIPQIVKRQQDNPFEINKKIRTFLDLGNEKSVNHFSQSARVLQKRSSPPPLHDSQSLISGGRSRSRRSTFSTRGALHTVGRSHSDPCSSSSFLSRLNASLEEDNHKTDNTKSPVTQMQPPMIRSRTFTTGTSELYFQSTLNIKSPFLISDSNSRSNANTKSTRLFQPAKYLTQRQSQLRQTILDPSFDPQKRALSFKLSAESPILITQTATSCKSQDQSDRNPSGCMENGSGGLGSSIGSSLASCTEAMNSLSPPSAKVPSLLNAISKQRDQSTTVNTATSLSLPFPNTGSLSFWDSEDDEVSQLKIRSPCSLISSSSDSIISEKRTPTKSFSRPSILRRHQTMITKRSEFMRTLERESQSRAMGLNNTLSRKPLVFAPENYAPDPSREDCRILPCTHFISKPDDTTKRIAPQTVVDVLDGKYKDKYDLLYIIDCRFPYEFEGGHIKTAVNVNTTNELEKLLLQPAITDKRVLLIFHCEFSCERGPRMARHLRNQDRAANTSHYPAVFYPEIYVMEGGYSGFFKDNRGYCWPEAYVEMRDEKHSKEFEEHMRTFGREFSRSASKGFLGTESRKSRSENDSSQASYASKGKPTNNTLTTSKTNSNSTTTSVSSPNPTSAARSANTRSTNAVSSKSTENHNSSKNSPSNIEVSSSKNNTSTSTNKNHSNEPKHSTRETSKVSNKNTFSSVLSSVKAAALLGSPSSPLSLPATSKTFVPSQSILSRFLALQRPIARPRNSRPLAERVLKDLSKPAVACTSTVSDATATNKKIQGNPASNYNPNLNSNTLPNPFFSGFRQTKPVFRGASP